VGACSKKALVQTGCECAKQLAFTNGPFGRPAKKVMTQIAERFAKVFRSIRERLYDIERLREREDTRQPKQELLPNSMTGL
jgi:hypothetical protein